MYSPAHFPALTCDPLMVLFVACSLKHELCTGKGSFTRYSGYWSLASAVVYLSTVVTLLATVVILLAIVVINPSSALIQQGPGGSGDLLGISV